MKVLVSLTVSTRTIQWQNTLRTGDQLPQQLEILSVMWAHFGASPERA